MRRLPRDTDRVTDRAARFDVLGVPVSPINMSQALAAIFGWVARREQHYVCVTDVCGVMAGRHDDGLRRIHAEAGLVTPDGIPLVLLGRGRGYANVRCIHGPDLLLACCAASVARGYRHFFYGGAGDVAESLAAQLRARFPGLLVVGTHSPPFRPLADDEDAHIVRRINETGADFVWVGLSTPKQERWMRDHVGRLTAPVLVGVGAAFDYLSGRRPRAPRWMRRSGLEWCFGLATEPKRLWRRYLVDDPRFAWEVVRGALGRSRGERAAARHLAHLDHDDAGAAAERP
ncbi:MAG: WecB/TagA/CpsF family glycosyltransferase [Gemmatimonadaceae bacterium]